MTTIGQRAVSHQLPNVGPRSGCPELTAPIRSYLAGLWRDQQRAEGRHDAPRCLPVNPNVHVCKRRTDGSPISPPIPLSKKRAAASPQAAG